MEELHMSFKEVYEIFPINTLLIMQKDKRRVTTGEKMTEVTEEEYFKIKGAKKWYD